MDSKLLLFLMRLLLLRGVGERCDSTDVVNVGVKEVGLEGVASDEGVVSDSMTGKSDHAKVKDTLRIFNNYYLHFVQELTYDYGYALDSATGPDGTIKKMPCYCGAAGCWKRLY